WRGILRCRLLCRRLLRRRLIAARRTREAAIGDVVGFDILELARRRETLNGAARRQCDVILELTLADDPRAAIGWAPLDRGRHALFRRRLPTLLGAAVRRRAHAGGEINRNDAAGAHTDFAVDAQAAQRVLRGIAGNRGGFRFRARTQ